MTPHIFTIYKEQFSGWRLYTDGTNIRLRKNELISCIIGNDLSSSIQEADKIYLKYSKVANELEAVNKSKRSHQESFTIDLP